MSALFKMMNTRASRVLKLKKYFLCKCLKDTFRKVHSSYEIANMYADQLHK